MGRKKKPKRNKARATSHRRELSESELVDRLQSFVRAGKARQALEILKELRHRGILSTYASLAEEAYRLRAEQLHGAQLDEEALDVLRNAAASGLRSAGLATLALEVTLASGKAGAGRRAVEQTAPDDTFRAHCIADAAVLLPGLEAPESLARDVQSIRRAFAHYERGNEGAAREEMQSIGRRSPLARWRLLLRGLIAQSAGHGSEAQAAWQRIDDTGACGRLARALPWIFDASAPDDGSAAPAQLDDGRAALLRRIAEAHRRLWQRLEHDAGEAGSEPDEGTDEPVGRPGPLEAALIAAVRDAVRRWPGGLSGADRRRLFRSVSRDIVLSHRGFQELSKLLGELPEDREGYRQAALHFGDRDPEQACELWGDYLERFHSVTGLSPEARRLARAMVLGRLGDIARLCTALSDMGGGAAVLRSLRFEGRDEVPDPEECYEQALALDPDSAGVRERLVSLYRETNREKQAERLIRERAERSPQDAEALRELGELCYERASYRKALRYFEKARALEPLDRGIVEHSADCLAASAERRSAKGRCDLARLDLRRLEDLFDTAPPPRYRLVGAAVERMAGERTKAEAIVAGVVEEGMWPVEAYVAVAASLQRMEALTGEEEFWPSIGATLKSLPRDRASVLRLVRLLPDLRSAAGSRYESGDFGRQVRRYLHRTQKQPLSAEERAEVCEVLYREDEFKPAREFARVGRREFPETSIFPVIEAQVRLCQGDFRLPVGLRRALERALERAEARGDLEEVKSILVLFLAEQVQGGSPMDRLSDSLADEDEDEEEEGEDGEARGRSERIAGRGSRSKRRRPASPYTQKRFEFEPSSGADGGSGPENGGARPTTAVPTSRDAAR